MAVRSVGIRNLSDETIRRIRRMIAAVEAEPEFYDQNTFGKNLCKDDGGQVCGTVCCAAGWAVWLDNKAKYDRMMKLEVADDGEGNLPSAWVTAGMKALALDEENGDLAEHMETGLFSTSYGWPYPFASDYNNARTPKQRAKAFRRRWEHFIKTDGED